VNVNVGVFENELIEGQIEGSPSIDCQNENELTPKGKAKVTVSLETKEA
jgi:hypothetical protein